MSKLQPERLMRLKLSEIATLIQAEWNGTTDPNISGAGSVQDGNPGEIVFAQDQKNLDLISGSPSAIIIPQGCKSELPHIISNDPQSDFIIIMKHFSPPLELLFPNEIHTSAVIADDALVGQDVSIGPYSIIGSGVEIGAGTKIASHVVIEPNCTLGSNNLFYSGVTIRQGTLIGNDVILHPGVVIGSDGFGYKRSSSGVTKVPHIGNVIIENNVEIGANSCVDRSTTGSTLIKSGVKLDNLVQIAHNVKIGEYTAISAQSGVSGSCIIGKGVVVGGQSGCADHVTVGDGVQIAAKTAVTRDVEAGKTVIGFPEIEIKKGYRIFGLIRKLPDLFKRVRDLENLNSHTKKSQE
jgi:UDP-3-O-[3-hydroxymyristoyl] glucosamine N-acyltransferase